MEPFLFCGKEDVWVLGVEIDGLSYVRPSHRTGWKSRFCLGFSLVLSREEGGEKGQEKDGVDNKAITHIHPFDKNYQDGDWRETLFELLRRRRG